MEGFSSKRRALTAAVLWDRKMYICYGTGKCTFVMGPENVHLQARPCTIQPGNCTGWGSEEVKQTDKDVDR